MLESKFYCTVDKAQLRIFIENKIDLFVKSQVRQPFLPSDGVTLAH